MVLTHSQAKTIATTISKMFQINVANDRFFNEKYREYQQETVFTTPLLDHSCLAHLFGTIFLILVVVSLSSYYTTMHT